MEYKVTLKSGERGEGEVVLSVIAGDDLDATKWGEAQMKAWGWTHGSVIRVDCVGPVVQEPHS